jgi:hypothetical protein
LYTPSGLSIGIIKKLNNFLNIWALKSSDNKNDNIPYKAKLDVASPGWTRAVIIIVVFEFITIFEISC